MMAPASNGCFEFNLPFLLIEEFHKLEPGQEVQLCGTNVRQGILGVQEMEKVTLLASKIEGNLSFSFHTSTMGQVFKRRLTDFWNCEINSMVIGVDVNGEEDQLSVNQISETTLDSALPCESEYLELIQMRSEVGNSSLGIPTETEGSLQNAPTADVDEKEITSDCDLESDLESDIKKEQDTKGKGLHAYNKTELSHDEKATGPKTRTRRSKRKTIKPRKYLQKFEKEDTKSSKKRQDRPHKCQQCTKAYWREEQLAEHAQTHDPKTRYTCTICDSIFRSKSACEVHERRHKGKIPKSKGPQTCSVCNMVCSSKSGLTYHMRIHTGEKPFVCSTCGRAFAQHITLQTHMHTHTGDRPYKCNICGKGFTQHTSRSKHQRIHRGEKSFICSECGQGFRDKQQLRQHNLIHTGEKPHSCRYCGKCFRAVTNLLCHERIHTGVLPYVCAYCAKGFKSKTHLTRHERIHTGEKPYVCNICTDRFTQREALNRHKLTH